MKKTLGSLFKGLLLLACAAVFVFTAFEDYTLLLFRVIPIGGIFYDILAFIFAGLMVIGAFFSFKSMFEK